MKYTKLDLSHLRYHACLFNESLDRLHKRCSDIMDIITDCFEVPSVDYLNLYDLETQIKHSFSNGYPFIIVEVGWCDGKNYSLSTNNMDYSDSIPVDFLTMSSDEIRNIVMKEIKAEEIEAAKSKLTKEERNLLGVS